MFSLGGMVGEEVDGYVETRGWNLRMPDSCLYEGLADISGSLCTRYPLSHSLAPSPSAYPTPQRSGELGAKSPIYLSRSPSSHPCRPQLPSQLLIDCLSGCLLFWWVTGACVTCGKWPDEGGVGEAKPQKTLERG